ncbi:predicted protein [Histoplasma capsulatum H143]|uniref:Uncharacterized protein n=1 Tax=Ajellomyces capsulatus (strain H143) TaxID=544712 RepID=C6HEW4_AJECH|nr:predicted protein [Histoplasma capsulatum H143]
MTLGRGRGKGEGGEEAGGCHNFGRPNRQGKGWPHNMGNRGEDAHRVQRTVKADRNDHLPMGGGNGRRSGWNKEPSFFSPAPVHRPLLPPTKGTKDRHYSVKNEGLPCTCGLGLSEKKRFERPTHNALSSRASLKALNREYNKDETWPLLTRRVQECKGTGK